MESIQILSQKGKVRIIIDGVELRKLHSFSVDYIAGAPLLFSCVADVDAEQREGTSRLVS